MFDRGVRTPESHRWLSSSNVSRAAPSIPGAVDTLILALGNALRGDDGVGIAVTEALYASGQLPKSTTLCECSVIEMLTELLSRSYERVIIVDAADTGCPPGAWRRFQAHKAIFQSVCHRTALTLHHINLAKVLALGDVLGVLPMYIIIYCVQPKHVGWTSTLSEPVQKAVLEVTEAILSERLECGFAHDIDFENKGCAEPPKHFVDKRNG
ncbi:MAG: hydrogenase maturation protease [Anaerolineales bacterium]|nr:hydrogenase maturation protease [Anaerolineales bacterium]